jgi:hypothetical protein
MFFWYESADLESYELHVYYNYINIKLKRKYIRRNFKSTSLSRGENNRHSEIINIRYA